MPESRIRSRLPLLTPGILAGFLTAYCVTLSTARAQDAISPPTGWHREAASSEESTFSPDSLAEGKVFTLTVHTPSALGETSLREWFGKVIGADALALGTVISNGTIQDQPKLGGLSSAKGIRDSSGRQLIVLYIAQPIPSGEARFFRVVSSPEADVYKTYMPQASDVIASLLRRGISNSGSSTVSSHGGSAHRAVRTSPSQFPAPQTGAASSALKDRRLSYTTKPGAGLKPSQIAGIYASEENETGVGGDFYTVYAPLIAFRDGTYYSGFDVPPSDFNLAAAQESRPKAWGKWRWVGGKIQIFNQKRGWIPQEWLGPFSGGSARERLSGTYSHLSGGGNTAYGGGTQFASVNGLTFYPDGHFSGGSITTVSSHDSLSNTGVEGRSSSKYDGTYSINGYTLELRYNDGRVDQRSFVYMDDRKNGGLYLNGVAYLKDKKR